MGGCGVDYMVRKGIPRFDNSRSKKVVPCAVHLVRGISSRSRRKMWPRVRLELDSLKKSE